MADIIALPCAANQPVVQERRRGRLPNRYPSIPRILRDRDFARYQEEQRREEERQRAKLERSRWLAGADAHIHIRIAGNVWDARMSGSLQTWGESLDVLLQLVHQIEVDMGFGRRAPVLALAAGGNAQ
ncbi:hypothetical protein [Cupriavidus gilardii]|uniref:hypothetical protein n=1 Tax=Cupriavidus gilardii TaxID=82541 RepID=UPI0021B1923B|nr:hypothetical protein [Cupriavidus gilardii]UXC37327.1 hypothetical protein N4G38_07790 [Cupriavidus gilardii]